MSSPAATERVLEVRSAQERLPGAVQGLGAGAGARLAGDEPVTSMLPAWTLNRSKVSFQFH
jgi:hypothetical protein